MSKVNFYIGKKTDIGNIKNINEDSFIVKNEKIKNKNCVMIAVCDGLGGLELGDVASKIAVAELERWWNEDLPLLIKKSKDKKILQALEKSILSMNKKVLQLIYEKKLKMGTTVSCLLIIEKKYYIAHIGDSRIYKFDNDLELLTEDHTYYESLRRKGLIEESKKVKKNILTQCVGSDEIIKVYTNSGKFNSNCTFMACTDGYYNKMNRERTKNRLKTSKLECSKNEELDYICSDLVENVKSKGEKDNITLVIVNIDVRGIASIINKILEK